MGAPTNATQRLGGFAARCRAAEAAIGNAVAVHAHFQDDVAAVTTIEPDDGGTHLEATVEVTLDDGSVLSQSPRNSPRALVFQDQVRVTEVIEEASAGRSGVSLAKTLVGALDSGEPVPVATLLDRLSSVH
jgi:hypothetical protein